MNEFSRNKGIVDYCFKPYIIVDMNYNICRLGFKTGIKLKKGTTTLNNLCYI